MSQTGVGTEKQPNSSLSFLELAQCLRPKAKLSPRSLPQTSVLPSPSKQLRPVFHISNSTPEPSTDSKEEYGVEGKGGRREDMGA